MPYSVESFYNNKEYCTRWHFIAEIKSYMVS
jgi:hypothetical protein